jgi:hypothetical protein
MDRAIEIPVIPGEQGTRNDRVGMIRPMRERWDRKVLTHSLFVKWLRASTIERRQRVHDLCDLTLWLDFSISSRWQTNARGGTYCDHAAMDWWAYWLGREHGVAVTPPLAGWTYWTDAALLRLEAGEAVVKEYGSTVRELGATGLFDWLAQYGKVYGWQTHATEADLRNYMNLHHVPGLVICRTKGAGASHVSVALPDEVERAAISRGARLVENVGAMLTTEAGGRNRTLTRRRWWASGWSACMFLTLNDPRV